MHYDDGEVLQGINEPWTFMGANAMEWACGLVVFLMISLFSDTPARAMPMMLTGWILTTVSLASLRNKFPDEERGTRNWLCTKVGVTPPGIPAPAQLQPLWSHMPVRELPETCKFVALGLEKKFPSFVRDLKDADEE